MAYIRALKETCRRCTKAATVEVVTFRNESAGKFCRMCGDKELKNQLAIEKNSFAPKPTETIDA